MVLIPAGEFTMGRTKATPDDETGMRPLILRDDRPPHKVRLDAFHMDRHETTHGEYARFLEATGRGERPITGSTARCRPSAPIYRSITSTGTTPRPTANGRASGCRPRPSGKGRRAAASTGRITLGATTRRRRNERAAPPTKAPVPLGSSPPNAFGLYDMAGGVAEWCADWFERTYYETSPAENPQGPAEGMYRIIRGGAWSDGPRRITVFFRNWVRPNQRTPNLGFRCVRDAD